MEVLAMTPRQVQLPCCPVCGNVGKQPGDKRFSSACTGPKEQPHPRAKMDLRTFEEVDRLDAATGEGRR